MRMELMGGANLTIKKIFYFSVLKLIISNVPILIFLN